MADHADIRDSRGAAEFRRDLMAFMERVDVALLEMAGSVQKTQEWLDRERIPTLAAHVAE